jgi:agmatine deiminase
MKKHLRKAALLALLLIANNNFAQTYTFPDESEPHEGTWLQWPHQYEYGTAFRNENDATWVAMTSALQANEKVHIIAYNATEQTRITNLLTAASVPLTNVTFKISQTNDVWARDNFGVFLRNASGALVLGDFGFNGWGGDYNFTKDNLVPAAASAATGIPLLNLNSAITVEGGAYEMDGAGTFLATKTAILCQANPSTPTGVKALRNVGMTEAQANAKFAQYLGATKFIWLDGTYTTEDITDFHIDGFAKFAPGNKLVTMSQADLLDWGVTQSDINKLYGASNANNVPFTIVTIPLTVNNVKKMDNTDLGYKGSYANYYVANNRVLVPNYGDANDAVANNIIAGLYPGRTVVGINVRNLYGNGGMVHCVTQQQPMATAPLSTVDHSNANSIDLAIYPNPSNGNASIRFNLKENTAIKIAIYNILGAKVAEIKESNYTVGENTIPLNSSNLSNGIYICQITSREKQIASSKLVISK